MTDEYLTISDTTIGEGYYSEKRSKFLAFAHHAESEEQVRALVSRYRKRYYDARHVCYAYMLRRGPGTDSNSEPAPYYRANDDGEPSSTAGKPILGQINSHGLTDTLVVVVRYYGGVNLGTGGLIVAYRTAAAEALTHSDIVTRTTERELAFTFPYAAMNGVMKIVKDMAPRIVQQTFDNTCRLRLAIRTGEAPLLAARMNKITGVEQKE